MSRKSNREICDLYKGKNRDEVTLKYFGSWIKKASGNAYLPLYDDFVGFSKNPEYNCENEDNASLYRVLRAWLDLQEWKKLPVWGRLSAWKYSPAWKEWKETTFPIKICEIKTNKEIGKIEDEEFVLNFKESDSTTKKIDLDFLEGIDIDILNPAKNRGGKANQKWHLYVSIFAFSVVCDNAFDWGKKFVMKNNQPPKCRILRLWMIENTKGQEDVLKKIEEAIDHGEVEEANKTIDDTFKEIMEEHA